LCVRGRLVLDVSLNGDAADTLIILYPRESIERSFLEPHTKPTSSMSERSSSWLFYALLGLIIRIDWSLTQQNFGILHRLNSTSRKPVAEKIRKSFLPI
jgi:hypothetical protein